MIKYANLDRNYFWTKYKHLFYLLYYAFIGVLYMAFNEIVTSRTYMYLPLIDDMIPFVKAMVIPYVIWYAYIIMPLVYFAFTDVESYTNLCIFLFVGMTVCFIIFAIFPNGQNLRPTIIGNDILSVMIRNIYETDNPINSAPSIHVLNSIAVHAVLTRSKRFKGSKKIKVFSFLLMFAIICSTVMIKQHSIIDLVAGVFLAYALKTIIYSESFSSFIKRISAPAMKLFKKQPYLAADLKFFFSNLKNKDAVDSKMVS